MKNVIEELNKLPNLKIDGFKELFHDSYEYAFKDYKINSLKKGTRFVVFEEEILTVWILISGEVKALEEYYTGDRFIFKKFQAPEVFGEMEILAEMNNFIATLITETDCIFLNIPVEIYNEILKSDPEYLYKRINLILKRVIDEKKHLRAFLMLKSIDRIKIYLTNYYELHLNSESVCILRITRQQISEELGCAIKTVNRGIKQLEKENLLKIDGQRIIITADQYKKMYNSITSVIHT